MARRQARREPHRSQSATRSPAGWLMRGSGAFLTIGILTAAVSGAYLLYGILTGHLTPEPDLAQRASRIFETGATVFTVASIIICTALFVRYYEEPLLVYVGVIPGLLAFFAVPFLVGAQNAQGSLLAQRLMQSMRLCGEIVFMLVALRAGIAVVDRVRRPPEPKKAVDTSGPPRKPGVKPPVWGKCWQLSYCHEVLREVCPNYTNRRNCWKVKKGCNCDETMIDRLVQVRSTARGTPAGKQQTAKEYTRDELLQPRRGAPARQMMVCSKCPIYAEHQRQKFLILNPLVIVVSIALFYFGAPVYTTVYSAALLKLDAFSARFAFEPATGSKPQQEERQQVTDPRAVDRYNWRAAREAHKDAGGPLVARRALIPESQHRMASWLGSEMNEVTVHWIIYVVLCIFLLTQILHAVEWAVFKMHW